ncbi:MAG: hypothetical protein JWM48_3194, partial [Mycobacterium sp.]|nr:hypothetical protein [Mycobacterium sp.]
MAGPDRPGAMLAQAPTGTPRASKLSET